MRRLSRRGSTGTGAPGVDAITPEDGALTVEGSTTLVPEQSVDFAGPGGIEGTARGRAGELSGRATGSAVAENGALRIAGNASARATLAAGSVQIDVPDKTFTLRGEQVNARFGFTVAADAFAGADANVSVDVGVTEAGMEAGISGFAGARAIATAVGELRWARRTPEDYAKAITRHGLLQKKFGHLLPDNRFADRIVERVAELLIETTLGGGETTPLVLGVTATGEASVGIGGSASFSAGMRGGMLHCSGRGGVTFGLGAGYNIELLLGVRDGLGMIALMALAGGGNLADELRPGRDWVDFTGELIRNAVTGRTLFERTASYARDGFRRVRELGSEDGIQGEAAIRGGGLIVHADGRLEIADGGLRLAANAEASLTLVDGTVRVELPARRFMLMGEQLTGSVVFHVGARAFAEARGNVDANLGVTGAGLEASISGFAGARASASGVGELRWSRRSSDDYADRIVNLGIFERTFGDALGDGVVERITRDFVRRRVTRLVDYLLTGTGDDALVLGVTATGEAYAGIGGTASFSAGMRGGVLYCRGSAGLTFGLGAGYSFDVALGVRDGMTMLALMALSGFDLTGSLQPPQSWRALVGDQLQRDRRS